VGAGTGISYPPGAPLATILSSFLLYSLVTPTAGWDTLRAVTPLPASDSATAQQLDVPW
jgi:energy-coupling factor transport system ATP-binding protein